MSLRHIKNAQARIKDMIKEDVRSNPNFKSIFPGIVPMNRITTYALNSGKRLRPMIVGSLCGFKNTGFVLFIEYVHNSSLIVDDLPCMDNDTERRGVPTVHVKYGEYMSQLVAYNLMITAMKHFSDGFRKVQNEKLYTLDECNQLYDDLNQEINDNLGNNGIAGGQLLDILICKDVDLRSKSPRESRELIMKVIRLKTGCLFSLCFTLGWIGSGRSIAALADMKEAGYCFGICYQIIDDLRDVEKDNERNGGYNNICKYYTWNEIIDLFTDNIERFAEVMTVHQAWTPIMHELYSYMLVSFREGLRGSGPARR